MNTGYSLMRVFLVVNILVLIWLSRDNEPETVIPETVKDCAIGKENARDMAQNQEKSRL